MYKITKTDFRRFLDCPGEFWLSRNRKDLLARDYDREAQFRIRQGYSVQKLAEAWLQTRGDAEYAFQRKVESETSLALLDGYAATANGAWIVEIKSSNNKPRGDKSNRADRLKQLNDIGFQVLVARESGENVGRALLLTVNPQFELEGDIDFDRFFVIEDVLDEIDELMPEIVESRRQAFEFLDRPPVIDFERLCAKKLECEFVRFLKEDIPSRNVGQIPRITGEKIKRYADAGIFALHDVVETDGLSPTQRRYVETAQSPMPIIETAKLNQLLRSFVFPLYFLDYESVGCPIPLVEGARPWQQLVFQYSLHIIERRGSDPEHREFVSDGTGMVPLELAESLARDLGPTGTVIVWNKTFEKARNSEIGSMFGEFTEFFANVNDRIFDLKDVFDDGLYRHPDIVNHSIKSVLPVIAPDLDYHELEIGNGGTASAAWFEDVLNGDGQRKEETLCALREYCGLDTLAMVRIYGHLASKAGH